jgi:hypothetical protein
MNSTFITRLDKTHMTVVNSFQSESWPRSLAFLFASSTVVARGDDSS